MVQEVKGSGDVPERQLLSTFDEPGTLHFTELDFTKDDGRYVCVISNSLGSFEMATDLHVTGRFRFI